MKDLAVLLETCEKMGFSIDSLTLREGAALLVDLKRLINDAIIESDNK